MPPPVIPNTGPLTRTTLTGDELFYFEKGSQDQQRITAANLKNYTSGSTGSTGPTGATGPTGPSGGMTGATGTVSPLPFFGNQTNQPWVRPDAYATFDTWLNQTPTGLGTATATDNPGGLPLVMQAMTDVASTDFSVPTALLKSIGAPPWTITVALAFFCNVYNFGGSNFPATSWSFP